MSDWPWVIAAYALTWIVLAVYAGTVHRRFSQARQEMERELDRTSDSKEMQP